MPPVPLRKLRMQPDQPEYTPWAQAGRNLQAHFLYRSRRSQARTESPEIGYEPSCSLIPNPCSLSPALP
jgi:hypothetical protein